MRRCIAGRRVTAEVMKPTPRKSLSKSFLFPEIDFKLMKNVISPAAHDASDYYYC